LIKKNATLALRYAEAAIEAARDGHVALIAQSPLFSSNESALDDYIVTPTKVRVRQGIEVAEKNRTSDPTTGATQSITLIGILSKYAPLLSCHDAIRSRSDVVGLYDEVAAQCLQSVISFHGATNDYDTATTTLERVLPLARAEELRLKIENNIAIGKRNIAFAKMAVLLDPLTEIEGSKSSPKERLAEFLRAVEPAISKVSAILNESEETKAAIADRLAAVLRDISIDAWNEQKDGVTALDALSRADSYAVSAELKAKLAEDRAILTRVYAEQRRTQQAEKNKKYGWGIGIAVVALILIAVNINGGSSDPVSAPQSLAPTPSASLPNEDSSARSATTSTYRVPNYISSELDRDRAAAESAKQEAASLGVRLQAMNRQLEDRKQEAQQSKDELDSLGSSIERKRAFVSQSDDASLEAFNAEVARYNQLLKRAQQKMKYADELVDPYDALLAQVNAKEREADHLVDAYNAKLRQHGR
jgi:hypothetical protein